MAQSKDHGLTASDLKYLAILAMFIDHAAILFLPYGSLLYSIVRFIGRFTAPIMCFFISEGYHHTRNLKKYFERMAVFAVISHFAYAFCFSGGVFESAQESMITTLFLCLLAVHLVNSGRIDRAFKLPLIMLVCFLAEYCDWGAEAVIYTLSFELARGKRTSQMIAYAATAALYKLVPLIKWTMADISYFTEKWFVLGVFLPIPLLLLYKGEKGGGRYTKWVFYIFYPAHLLLLGIINEIYG